MEMHTYKVSKLVFHKQNLAISISVLQNAPQNFSKIIMSSPNKILKYYYNKTFLRLNFTYGTLNHLDRDDIKIFAFLPFFFLFSSILQINKFNGILIIV